MKCELAGEILRSFGKLRLQATGWSMLPAVRPGDTLVVDRVSRDSVAEGDIVVYRRDRRLVAHRVVQRSASHEAPEILTRGDAMSRPDPPVREQDVLGRVAWILRNGKLIAPGRGLSFSERAVAALVRNSELAARVVVGVHGMRGGRIRPATN